MIGFQLIVCLMAFHKMPSAAPDADHDFKMSVCEIVYSQDKEMFDVKFYLFQDDFKAVLYGDANAPNIEETKAGAYIIKHFNLNIDGQTQAMTYHSMREKNDQVLVQFTSPKISTKSISKIGVKNTLFLEKFRDQINMLYLVLPEKSKMTQMLNATRTEGSFSL